MKHKKYISVETVMKDYDISKSKAYVIIRELNKDLKAKYPSAIIVSGKVNRRWYEQACLTDIK